MSEPSSHNQSRSRRPRPGRLGVGIVSAGRVGAVLGSALRAVDHRVVGVHAVSEASRERAEMLLPGVPVLEVEQVVRRAELVLLAVPDDELAGLVGGLADVGAWRAGQLVVHTSGRYGADVLAPAQRAGAVPIALHPAMTFSGYSTDVARLTGCPMAVTAPAAFLPVGQALAVELGGEPFVLEEGARPAYHAALAHGANHLVTLVGQAVRALEAAGVGDGAATLRPLLTWWTALIPGRSPAWFAARANARHRASLSMTTIVPFAIAVAMTGTVYAAVGAGQATGAQGSVNGFLTVGVPIFLIAGVGGIANIAMVGRARRQEGALLGVIGARTRTVLASTALEGVIYAVTGILFGLAATAFSAVYAALYSGGGMTVLVSSVPVGLLALVSGISLALAVATTWLPAQLDRRSLMDNLRQPV